MKQQQENAKPCQYEQARNIVARKDAGEVVCRAKFEQAEETLAAQPGAAA